MPSLSTLHSEVLTIAATPLGLTLSTDAGELRRTIKAVIGPIETSSIRYTTDADVTVSATRGHLVQIGDIITIWGNTDLNNFRAHRTGGVSAAAEVHYEG